MKMPRADYEEGAGCLGEAERLLQREALTQEGVAGRWLVVRTQQARRRQRGRGWDGLLATLRVWVFRVSTP